MTQREMRFEELAAIVQPTQVVGDLAGTVRGLAYDSRAVQPGTLFFAVPGDHADGHDFAAAAAAAGAIGLVVERAAPDVDLPQLVVARTRDALADAADAWFGRPSERLEVIGVTGTDGKTTTCFLSVAVLLAGGHRPGMIGTVDLRIGDRQVANDSRATTPESLELHGLLAEMVEAGNDSVVMEATSIGLAQSRTRNCRFRIGVVTNLTSEHLEFHGTLGAYREAKAHLVDEAPTAILNADDSEFGFFRARARGRLLTYAQGTDADLRAVDVDAGPHGTVFTVVGPRWRGPVHLPLVGSFNVSNALAALALAEAEEIDPDVAAMALGRVDPVPGRMERIDEGQAFGVVVDYAHTADSLAKVLSVLRPLTVGRLLVVFGSAGERDRVKRPAMGRAAAELADLLVVADEDPRLEDPDAVNAEIAAGARDAGAATGERLFVINDRREAIRFAIGQARAGDVVLLAGKGHEGSMIYGTQKRWWDERQVARQELRAAGWGRADER